MRKYRAFYQPSGEVRKLNCKIAFNTSFSPYQLPDTHLLLACFSLALTCRQIYHEVYDMMDSNVLVHGEHTMRTRFFQQLPLGKAHESRDFAGVEDDSWIRYHDWRKGIYYCVTRQLCASEFRPTTLIFNSDFRTGNVSRISSRTSEARFANVRKDLRFALSIMLTIQTVHCADVGTHGGCYRFAHMFDKFIPSDVDKVQHGARNFNSLHYHGALNGSSTES